MVRSAICRRAGRAYITLPSRPSGELVMTEFHTVKSIDNSRLLRPAPAARLRDLWRRLGAAAALAACVLFYAWQHFECIQIRYQLERLQSERAQTAELNQQLHLEVATLRSPMRVDAIARNQRGLHGP